LLTLDPSDAYCQLGLGIVALKRKRLMEAEQRLRTALAHDDCLLDAQRALGDTLARLGRRKEAILAYERALKLGIRGGKTLYRPIATGETEKYLPGSINWTTLARLGSLYAEEGDVKKAVDALRVSTAGGGQNSMKLRLRLARVYWEIGQRKDFALLLWQVIKMASTAIWSRSWRNLPSVTIR